MKNKFYINTKRYVDCKDGECVKLSGNGIYFRFSKIDLLCQDSDYTVG